MAKRNSAVIRTNPDFEKDLIDMKADMEKLESKNINMGEITKRITRTPSWKKVKDEIKSNIGDIDLRR